MEKPFANNIIKAFITDYCERLQLNPSDIDQICSIFNQLDPRQYILEVTGEYYEQIYYLLDKYALCMYWDIERLIRFIEQCNVHGDMVSPQSLIDNGVVDLEDPIWSEKLSNVQVARQSGVVFPHRVPYIIISTIPFFPDPRIIDGSHKFFEALLDNHTIESIVVSGPQAVDFMVPSSSSFIHALDIFSDIEGKPRAFPN